MSNLPIVLLAFANDKQNSYQFLQAQTEELNILEQTFNKATAENACEVKVLYNASFEKIIRTFQDKRLRDRIAIFHYSGHANNYQFLLEDALGKRNLIDGKSFMEFIALRESLELVFLNGCSTQTHADTLLENGIPLVIGTSENVLDKLAAKISSSFYAGLCQDMGIKEAWEQAISITTNQIKENDKIIYQKVFRSFGTEAAVANQSLTSAWNLYGSNEIAQNWKFSLASNNPLYGLPNLDEKYHYRLPSAPYIHLKPFEAKHAAIFFGRGKEIQQLFELIRGSGKIILIPGQTGVGKSSLLHAGLLPRLEQDYEVIYRRRDANEGALVTFQRAIHQGNHSAFKAWKTVESRTNKPLILILDQLEEVFTQPLKELNVVQVAATSNKIHSNSDQEIMSFFNVLDEVFGAVPVKGKIILSYREEYHARILKHLEKQDLECLSRRMDVSPLNKENIKRAIYGVTIHTETQSKYQLVINEEKKGDLGIEIADDLVIDNQSAIAPLLQIILAKMWEQVKEQDQRIFDTELYRKLTYNRDDNAKPPLEKFVDEQIDQLKGWKEEIVLSGFILDFLCYFTTGYGTTESKSKKDIAIQYSLQNSILPDLLERCQSLYLLAPSKDQTSFRLNHDTLAPIIREKFQQSGLPGQIARKVLETKALASNQQTTLDEEDLKRIELGKNAMRSLTEKEKAIIKRAENDRRKRKNQSTLRQALSFITIIIIIISAFLAFYQRNVAIKERTISEARLLGNEAEKHYPTDYNESMGLVRAAYERNKESSTISSILVRFFYQLAEEKKVLTTTIMPHNQGVERLFLDKKKKRLISQSKDNNVYIWSMDGELISKLEHSESLKGIEPDEENERIITLSSHLRIWNTNGTLLNMIKTKEEITKAMVIQEKKQILIQSRNENCQLWRYEGKYIRSIQYNITDKSKFDKKEKYVLTIPEHSTIDLLNIYDDSVVNMNHKNVSEAIFDVQSKKILSWSKDNIRLWNINGDSIATLNHKNVSKAIFDVQSKKILSWSKDSIRLWNINGDSIATLNHKNVSEAIFDVRSKKILSWSKDSIRLWNINGDSIATLKHKVIIGAIFDKDSERILSRSQNGTIKLWKINGELIAQMKHDGFISGVIFDQGEKSVISWSSDDESIYIWNPMIYTPPTMQLDYAINHDNSRNYVLNRSEDTIDLEDLLELEDIDEVQTYQNIDRIVGWSWWENKIRLWNLNGDVIRVMQHEHVEKVQLGEKMKRIVSWSNDSICIWDLDGNLIKTRVQLDVVEGGLVSEISKVTLEEGMNWILSCSEGSIRIWDLNGSPVIKPMKHEDANGALFAKKTNKILSWSDESIRLWNLDGELLKEIKYANVNKVLFNKQENNLLCWTENGKVGLLHIDGTLIGEWEHSGVIEAKLNEKEDQIISWSEDGLAKIWLTPKGICNYLEENNLAELPESMINQYLDRE